MSEDESLRALFAEALSHWPEELSVKEKRLHKNGKGATCPNLTAVHDEIEERINSQQDSYLLRQMDWALFTILHTIARYQDDLRPRSVNFEAVIKVYERNLNHVDDDDEP